MNLVDGNRLFAWPFTFLNCVIDTAACQDFHMKVVRKKGRSFCWPRLKRRRKVKRRKSQFFFTFKCHEMSAVFKLFFKTVGTFVDEKNHGLHKSWSYGNSKKIEHEKHPEIFVRGLNRFLMTEQKR